MVFHVHSYGYQSRCGKSGDFPHVLRVRMVAASMVVLCVGVFGGCGEQPAAVPTASEAEDALYGAWNDAQTGAMCESWAASTMACDTELSQAPAVPAARPTIQCSATYSPGDPYTPAQVLRVTGTDGAGNTYQTDVGAIRTPDGVRLINAVFWVSATFGGEGDEESATFDPCSP